MTITIKPFDEAHWQAVWRIMQPVFRQGETYVFAPDISEQEAHRVWIDVPDAAFVALDEAGEVLGTYYIKANQPGLGAHVCNCGYIVAAAARGRGIASMMCEHSQDEARRMGFKSMQYNLVAATNEGAVRLWLKHGFTIIGTLPRAFNHARLGLVDAHIMYKHLS